MINEIKKYLIKFNEISFSVVFGSFVSKKTNFNSDLDIGIYLDKEIDLIKLGVITNEIEKISERRVDIVELNNIYNKSPLLAYNIVTNHKEIFVRDKDVFNNFKSLTLSVYFDTEKLRDIINNAFYNRIKDKKFGMRNYA
ncbi:MAG: nucleotidyltransferase domain-containing protein [Ignavibacteriales bacterium]|nr:nucleotidyltransferase domain-containing protein [Ignavibacteriales bacterium]